jgi:YegS/Rv2252/BmrU family lipid kinase
MRACLVFNPTARGEKARRFLAALERLRGECVLRPTERAGHAADLAAAACAEGFDTVVAAGGDGTVSEVVDGLARVPEALEHVRLGVIPLGTINVLAHELGLPRSPTAAWQTVQGGRELRIDLPRVDLTVNGQPATRHFVQLAGAGLDSRAIARVNWAWKKRVGPLAYVVAGFKALVGPQPLATAQAGGTRLAGTLILLGNGRHYGGKTRMFPDASLTDGKLDVRVFWRVTPLTLLRCGWAMLSGKPVGHRVAGSMRGEQIRVTCPEPLPVEVDGDNVGFTPAVFTLRREALRVLVPAG